MGGAYDHNRPPVFETIMGESVTSCRTSNQEGSTVINVSFLNETVVGKCEVRPTDISSGAQVGNPVEEIVSGLQVTACQRALVEYTTSLNNNTGVTVLFCNWPSMRTGFPNIMNASKATRLYASWTGWKTTDLSRAVGLFAFDEIQNVTLTALLAVDVEFIPAGTTVASHPSRRSR